MPTILITRPEHQTKATIQRLSDLGYTCIAAPLLAIRSAHIPAPTGDWDMVMITSQNVFPCLDQGNLPSPTLTQKPCFCVGTATAEGAASCGFKNIFVTQGNGDDLVQEICAQYPNPISILHIAGEDVTASPHHLIQQAGHRLTIWPLYKAEEVSTLPPDVVEQIKNRRLDGVLFYSSRTAGNFTKLASEYSLTDSLSSLHALTLSPAIADKISHLPWRGLTAAAQPSEDGIITELLHRIPVTRV